MSSGNGKLEETKEAAISTGFARAMTVFQVTEY